MSIPVKLHIDLATHHAFHSAHERLAEHLKFKPSMEWLMAFALSQVDAEETVRTLRQMGTDYLCNRVPLQ